MPQLVIDHTLNLINNKWTEIDSIFTPQEIIKLQLKICDAIH